MNEWKQRIGSAAVAVVGALMTMKGMTAETSWVELPGLLSPMAVLGLILIVWRAASGQGQMKVPDVKKLGKR